jgi:predicted AlkP superfamily pyrophosphatase or phosphodiesterase
MVGSSPSITPASHSSIGTGAFPRSHGVTAISFRDPTTGKVRSAFANRDPADEKLTTFSDNIDRAYGNKSLVGLLAWKNWHIGLLGHGAQTPGGDHDQLAIISSGPHVSGNDLYYSTPSYLDGYPGLTRHARELDRADGKADGEWMGHSILKLHDNPAWVEYESDLMQAMLKREGYGTDAVPDIFLTNFKITDIVGHQYSMDSPEEQAVLHAQDAALGRLVSYLDKAIKSYVVVVTADHGHTPNALRSGAWPISESELAHDIDAHFRIPSGESLIDVTSAVGPFLNHDVMTTAGVTEEDIAHFLNSYTLSDNWKGGQLPSGYQDRADEQILSAAFPQSDYPKIMQCAFGANKPPPGLGT